MAYYQGRAAAVDVPFELAPELLPGERVVWVGAPDPNRLFTAGDAFLVPFSLLWGGFSFFWFASAVVSGGLFFALFGVPFMILGAYFIAGRFVYKRWKARRTLYALTDRRAIALTTGAPRSIRAEYLDRVAAVNHTIRSDGSGGILFGNPGFQAAMYGNTGMGFFMNGQGTPVLAFYDLADARKVVAIIDELRRAA